MPRSTSTRRPSLWVERRLRPEPVRPPCDARPGGLSDRVIFRLYMKDSDLVLKTRGGHGDASRADQRYCGCGGMVDRVCGRCRTVGICRFVDLVIQSIGIWHIRTSCGMALCCA